MNPKELPITNRGFKDINPILFGHEACSATHSFGPYIRNYFLIHYVCSGCGVFINSVGKYNVKKGDIFIILPGETTIYYADENNPWEYIWIGFTGLRAERLKTLEKRVLNYGESTFFSMIYAVNLKNTQEEFLISKIFEILSVIFEGEAKRPNYVRQATDYIKATFMTDITAESIAATIGINRGYLSKLLKAELGMGLQEYIIKVRLENAKRLLSQGVSVGESARLSGFGDMFNFSKTFKKALGISPSMYKKENFESR